MAWTAADIPDQRGRVALVTGANSGIGFQAARQLAAHGATVLLGCRDAARAEGALERIRTESPDADVSILSIDLADLSSVAEAAAKVQADHDRLDLLVNNAGVMATPYRTTADGFELQFGTNHLGHFALTGRLLDLVTGTDGSRIVTVASQAHRFGTIDFGDLQHQKRYNPWTAYGQAKLANLLFTYELARRLTAAGHRTLAVACHPGYASTNLQTKGPQMAGNKIMERLSALGNTLFGQSDEAGALPTLRAATDPGVETGEYYGPNGPGESRGAPTRVQSNRASKDTDVARRLWQVSQDLTGVTYL